MNTPNPLIPQGSLQKQKTGGPSSVRIAVVTVVAIHVVFFGGLLMQGCKRDNTPITTSANKETNRLTLPSIEPPTNTFVASPTNLPEPVAAPSTGTVVEPKAVVDNTPAPSTESKDYTIVKGDSLYKIAKANGVTIGALTKANPKLDPSRLKVGEKIIIPASTKTASGGSSATESPANGGGDKGNGVYVVKAGDTLTKIAKSHGATVKAIRAANGLKTDRLNVGQKLKLPAPTATAAATNTP